MPNEELKFKTKEYIVSTSHISQKMDTGENLTLNTELYSFGDCKIKTFEISIHRFRGQEDSPEYLFRGFLSDLVSLIEDYQKLKKMEES